MDGPRLANIYLSFELTFDPSAKCYYAMIFYSQSSTEEFFYQLVAEAVALKVNQCKYRTRAIKCRFE